MARLRAQYEKDIKKALMEKFKYSNIHQIPKLEKIIVNCVTRDAVSNGKIVDSIVEDLAKILILARSSTMLSTILPLETASRVTQLTMIFSSLGIWWMFEYLNFSIRAFLMSFSY